MKRCRKCLQRKPLEDFYIHLQMADGYLNICKECTRARISGYRKTEKGNASEKRRNQTLKRKAWLIQYQPILRERHRIRYKARGIVANAIRDGKLSRQPCEVCGANGMLENGRYAAQAHHDDYSQPLQVRWLCQKHHKEQCPVLRNGRPLPGC